MDPNQTQTVSQPTQPVQPLQSTVQSDIPQSTMGQPKNNKMIFLVLAFVILILLGAGIFLLMKKKSTPAPAAQITTPPALSQVTPSPLPEVTQSPEQELQQVTIDNPDTDMQDINASVSQL